jgi:hypothetical protein
MHDLGRLVGRASWPSGRQVCLPAGPVVAAWSAARPTVTAASVASAAVLEAPASVVVGVAVAAVRGSGIPATAAASAAGLASGGSSPQADTPARTHLHTCLGRVVDVCSHC